MASYIPSCDAEQLAMLREIGLKSFDDLYTDIPASLRYSGELPLASGLTEQEVAAKMEALAAKNIRYRHIFRGAGAYNHYIPAIVRQVTAKEEFLTAYTPYQAEISQGLLQSIFEYQTMVCELTGLDAANASVYDGATAAAEAVAMCRDRKRDTVVISSNVDPKIISVVKTYCFGSGVKLLELPHKDGLTDLAAWEALDRQNVACLLVQSPNYFGLIEDGAALSEAAHAAGAKLIQSCNPIALALLPTPGECGADIAVAEGQPLGLPLAFGGPYLGIMAAKKELLRKLPGRIVGATVDAEGKRAFVLTLQAREQHIRREKAASNICSNEALCALTAAVYLAAMGTKGLTQAAVTCTNNAHYLCRGLEALGFRRKYSGEFFHEFVAYCPPAISSQELAELLGQRGYLAGLPLCEKLMLWCATEMNNKDEIDTLLATIKEILAQKEAAVCN